MKNLKYIIYAVLILSMLLLMGIAEKADSISSEQKGQILASSVEPSATSTTYAQEVWLGALEWCESRGKTTAINAVDLDGTASYYSLQFKPGTFRGFGEVYGVIPKGLSHAEIMESIKDTSLQKDIVRGMINDPSTAWETQFPWCVKKIGRPPLY